MAHGTRGRIGRAAYLGLGLLLGCGLAGCMGDKKLPLANKTPGPGLPGTPMVNGAGAARPGTPGGVNVNSPGGGMPGNGIQQAGGVMPAGGANPNNFGTVGTPARPGSTQQPYGQQPYGQQPYSQQPYGQQPYGQQLPSNPGVIPNVGPVGAANPAAGAARGQASDPSPLALSDPGPIPPSAPAGYAPSVTPVNYPPVAPPNPMAPTAPLPPNLQNR